MGITAKAECISNTITDAVDVLAAETDSAKQDAMFRAWITTMATSTHIPSTTSFSSRHNAPPQPALLATADGDEAAGA